jgi:L-arabinose isomerase
MDDDCIAVITWMHTFSPAKMWIKGLQALTKPMLHLHTQHGVQIPWASIDMDFMNLHQSAHGGREFGHVCARLGIPRTVVVGHVSEAAVCSRVGNWQRAALAAHALRQTRVARFGDNMRQVAVTDGDKVSVQMALGIEVDGYGVGDLVACLLEATDPRIDERCAAYEKDYQLVDELQVGGSLRGNLREQARIDLAFDDFLGTNGYQAFTTTFEDLHGFEQLPGLAVQQQMAGGRGFGAEGDWKTSALLHAMKAAGFTASFMEDYTYDFSDRQLVLGAHMLEVCPTISADRPWIEVHELGIGGKAAPPRLVFDAAPGPAVNLSLIDLGDRLRLVANAVSAVPRPEALPNLPVARAVWQPEPSLAAAAEAWILAGAAHHTVFARDLSMESVEDFAGMVGIELVAIDQQTDLRQLRDRLR